MLPRTVSRVIGVACCALFPLMLASAVGAQDGGYQNNGSWQQARSGQYGGGSPPPDRPQFNDPGEPVRGDAYSPPGGGGGGNAYSPRGGDAYPSQGNSYSPSGDNGGQGGYSARDGGGSGYGDYGPPPDQGGGYNDRYDNANRQPNAYEKNEIISAGHGFFGAVSQGLAGAVEYAFKSQGRPNGYILGEDAGGAFIVGLRYGEGMLFTKDAGDHKVFWQGPSLGYDAGADGSKTMVLVYNLRDPSEIYNRFGGAQGAAYLIGGVSIQFQKYGDVTLGVIRSGVGLRLGANIGYLKYTRAATWNPL